MVYTKYKYNVYFIIFIAIFSRVFGQNLQDIEQLKVDYNKERSSQQGKNVNNVDQNNLQLSTQSDNINIIPYEVPEDVSDSLQALKRFFGYNFFTKRSEVNFSDNLPISKDYLLGPGDQLIVSVWGETQLRNTYTISRDGTIYDEKLGLLNLSGKSLNESQQYLTKQFGRVYATIISSKPTSFIDVSFFTFTDKLTTVVCIFEKKLL